MNELNSTVIFFTSQNIEHLLLESLSMDNNRFKAHHTFHMHIDKEEDIFVLLYIIPNSVANIE